MPTWEEFSAKATEKCTARLFLLEHTNFLNRETGLRIAGGVLCFCNSSVLCRTRLQSPLEEWTWDDPGWRLLLLLVLFRGIPKHLQPALILICSTPGSDTSTLPPAPPQPLLLALTSKVILPFPSFKHHRPRINHFQPHRHPGWGSYWEHIPLHLQAAAAPPSAADLALRAFTPLQGWSLNAHSALGGHSAPTWLHETKQLPKTHCDIQGMMGRSISLPWRMKTETWGNLKKKPKTQQQQQTTPHNNQPPFTFLPCEILHGMSCLTHLWER